MPLSSEQVIAAFERYGDDPWIALIELQHDDWNGGTPVRLALNDEDVISNLVNYSRAPSLQIELPSDDETPAVASISIPNVDGVISREIELLTGAIDCSIYVVLASDPNTYGREFLKFKLRNVQWDAIFVSGELSQAQITNNRWPKHQVTPRYFSHLIA